MNLQQLKDCGEAPEWLNEPGLTTLSKGYLLKGETPKGMYHRVSRAAAHRLNKPEMESKFFDIIWKNWLCLASPILSNLGSERGLPISCLTDDTWINTRKDGKKIVDVEIGDEVLTHEGRYKKVLAKQSRMSDDDLYEIQIGTRLTKTKITGNHPILTNDGWVEVSKLDPRKHLVAVNKDLLDYRENSWIIDLLPHCKYDFMERDGRIFKKSVNLTRPDKETEDGTVSYYSSPIRMINVDAKVAWALGLWFAEGSLSKSAKKQPNGIRITMGSDEQETVDKWLSIVSEAFGINGSSYKSEVNREGFSKSSSTSWISCNVNSGIVGEYFASEFGTNCKTKEIPLWIIDLPKEILHAFVDGMMEGDGYFRKTKNTSWQITLANPKLLLALYNICLKLDIQTSLQMQSKASKIGTTKYVYTLVSTALNTNYKTDIHLGSGIPFGKLRYCRILSLKKLQHNERVWDISVEDDHSFSANGFIVHNCNSIHIGDNLDNILIKNHELGMLSKYGAGVGIYLGDLRPRGAAVKGTGGTSDGVVSWAKIYDSTIASVNQGATRRGAAAVYLPVDHPDIQEFLQIRKPTGDVNKRCMNLHHGVCITDEFMHSIVDGHQDNRNLYSQILTSRFETGEPYLFFTDNVERQKPECYKAHNLKIKTSNICLAADTQVLTNSGYRSISELVGKKVTIWDGQRWVSNNSFVQTGVGELYRIYLSDGTYVDATAKHKWYVKPADKRESEVKTYAMCRTEDLQPGVKIEYHMQTFNGDIRLESAYAKGFLLAEGTSALVTHSIKNNNRKPKLWVYKPKEAVLGRLKASIEETPLSLDVRSDSALDVEFLWEEKNNRFATKGLSCRRELLPWVTEYKKALPDEAYQWNKSSKLDFLAGFFDGDGCYLASGCYQIASISKDLLLGIQKILKSIGVRSTLSIAAEARVMNLNDGYGDYQTKQAWRLTISSYWANKLSNEIVFERLSQYDKKEPNRFCADFNRVVKVEKLPGIHPVYCTNVPTTHKFALANGVMSGNCNEIYLYTDQDHTFVCCLSSMNLARWDEWKDTDAVQTAIWFLDAVMEEYIQKAKNMRGFESSVRFAQKSRALGLGALGWHSLLQEKRIPFDCLEASILNSLIFKKIHTESEKATKALAEEYGEPEWCKGFGRRNSHLVALAPTVSNSLISGGLSPGIEPIAANVYVQNSAKGTFITKNPHLEKFLVERGMDTPEVWSQINKDAGSVLSLKGLSKEDKDVFLTAREINQFAIVRQAGARQKWIDQGQSVNLFFGANSDPKYVHEVHMEAWRIGLKGLYYCRTESVLRADLASRSASECVACEA